MIVTTTNADDANDVISKSSRWASSRTPQFISSSLPAHTQRTSTRRCKAWLGDVAHPIIPFDACLLVLIGQRRTRTSCRIPSHASVGEMFDKGNVQGEMSVPRGSMSVTRCIGVVNITRRRSTSCITLRRSSASWMNAQSLLHIGHCDKKNCRIE